jgi:hypothetical protein
MAAIPGRRHQEVSKQIRRGYIQSYDRGHKLQFHTKKLYDELQELTIDIATVKLWIEIDMFGKGVKSLFERTNILGKKVSSVACVIEQPETTA